MTLRISDLDSMAAVDQACGLFDEVWQARGIVPTNLLRAVAHAGGYAVGAWVGSRMVGASMAFRGSAREGGVDVPILHSHVTAILPEARGTGAQVKTHQRQWAAQRGIAAITWTFDPLVARNAYFNVVKLGVECREYLVDHYGDMPDGLNAGQGSDRLWAWWPTIPSPRGADVPAVVGPAELLDRDADDPVMRPATEARFVTVAVPPDVEALRRRDRDAGIAWRHAVRDTLGVTMAAGGRIADVTRDGRYVVDKGPFHAEPDAQGGAPHDA